MDYSPATVWVSFPKTAPGPVAWVIEALDASGAEEVMEPDGDRVSLLRSSVAALFTGRPTDLMFELLINTASDPDQASASRRCWPTTAAAEGYEVLDLLRQFPSLGQSRMSSSLPSTRCSPGSTRSPLRLRPIRRKSI